MIKAYDNETGIFIGWFHKGAFVKDPGQLILEMRFTQQQHRDVIEWYEKRIRLLAKIQKFFEGKEAQH